MNGPMLLEEVAHTLLGQLLYHAIQLLLVVSNVTEGSRSVKKTYSGLGCQRDRHNGHFNLVSTVQTVIVGNLWSCLLGARALRGFHPCLASVTPVSPLHRSRKFRETNLLRPPDAYMAHQGLANDQL